MPVYLIAHANDDNSQTTQAQIEAKSESEARVKFAERYPGRVIRVIGIAGKS